MPNRTRISIKLLVFAMLALPLFAQNLFAAEAGQPQDLAAFLGALADQPLPGGESFTPAPENKVVYCSYQPCPAGQSCWYCNRNWVCIFVYPDPNQVPAGCTGGPSQ